MPSMPMDVVFVRGKPKKKSSFEARFKLWLSWITSSDNWDYTDAVCFLLKNGFTSETGTELSDTIRNGNLTIKNAGLQQLIAHGSKPGIERRYHQHFRWGFLASQFPFCNQTWRAVADPEVDVLDLRSSRPVPRLGTVSHTASYLRSSACHHWWGWAPKSHSHGDPLFQTAKPRTSWLGWLATCQLS